ncbi:hypothetical protein PAXINDRAFT_66333, partial [Paxillus involutus ATCC 200175]
QVDFEPGDPRNPMNFSVTRKWAITVTACAFTGLAASAISTYTIGILTMTRDLNCSTFEATVGLSVYPLGFSLVPLLTSSLSEEFGRFRLYIISSLLFMLTHVMIALAPNIQTVIIARLLGGAFGSTGATLVGGTIADIWRPHERGFPMALFAIAAIGATGVGPLLAGWIESNKQLEWRWIQWISAIVSGVYFISVLLFLTETRSDIILARLACKIRKEKHDDRYRVRAENNKPSLLTLIKMSSVRPIALLTEPIVLSFSVWIGFTWGVLFCFIEYVVYIRTGYNHVMMVRQVYIRRLYEGGTGRRLGVSVRTTHALSCYGTTQWILGRAVHAYMSIPVGSRTAATRAEYSRASGPFLSIHRLIPSVLTGNLLGAIFPLFAQQIYDSLAYKWANTLFALVSVAMIPIPYILFIYGAAIRRRSKVSRRILAVEEEKASMETR